MVKPALVIPARCMVSRRQLHSPIFSHLQSDILVASKRVFHLWTTSSFGTDKMSLVGHIVWYLGSISCFSILVLQAKNIGVSGPGYKGREASAKEDSSDLKPFIHSIQCVVHCTLHYLITGNGHFHLNYAYSFRKMALFRPPKQSKHRDTSPLCQVSSVLLLPWESSANS